LPRDTENHPRDSAATNVTPDFERAASERTAKGHSDRPPKLRCRNVLADGASVVFVLIFQPRPNRFVFAGSGVEGGRESLQFKYVLHTVHAVKRTRRVCRERQSPDREAAATHIMRATMPRAWSLLRPRGRVARGPPDSRTGSSWPSVGISLVWRKTPV